MKRYIITYCNFYKENAMLELDKIENNEYICKCGFKIPVNHLFTSVHNETEEVINNYKKYGIINGDETELYKRYRTN